MYSSSEFCPLFTFDLCFPLCSALTFSVTCQGFDKWTRIQCSSSSLLISVLLKKVDNYLNSTWRTCSPCVVYLCFGIDYICKLVHYVAGKFWMIKQALQSATCNLLYSLSRTVATLEEDGCSIYNI